MKEYRKRTSAGAFFVDAVFPARGTDGDNLVRFRRFYQDDSVVFIFSTAARFTDRVASSTVVSCERNIVLLHCAQ